MVGIPVAIRVGNWVRDKRENPTFKNTLMVVSIENGVAWVRCQVAKGNKKRVVSFSTQQFMISLDHLSLVY